MYVVLSAKTTRLQKKLLNNKKENENKNTNKYNVTNECSISSGTNRHECPPK